MKLRLARFGALISRTPALELEGLVRGLLVHYFFHVSNKEIVEVSGGTPEQPRVVNLLAPTVFKGRGRIRLTPTTVFGWATSPGSYRASYVEARNPGALIEIGAGTTINNGASLIAEGAGIRIGARCFIGTELAVLDTNAHELELGRRHLPDSRTQQVLVGDDVFIGSRVTLLKGCRIGNGCVIAAGAVLPPGFEAPAMSIVAGNPARVVGQVAGGAGPQASTAAAPKPHRSGLDASPTPGAPMNVQHIPIVTVSYNSPQLLSGLLTSLRKFYPNPVHVIDGSDPGPLAEIRTLVAGFEGVSLQAFGYNIHHGPGLAWAIENLGLSGPVLFLDTDIVVLRAGFLEALHAELGAGDYGVGGVGHVNQDGFDIDYGYGAIPYLHPPCMLCNIEVMRQWPLPVKHGAPMVEAMRALHRAGQSALLRHLEWTANDVLMGTRKVYIDHLGKGTSSATGGYHLEEWMAEVQAKRQRAADTGAPPQSYNPDLLALMPPAAARVLEVGCSTGALARAFKAINPNCDYRGIELDSRAAEGARRYCNDVSVLDIDTLAERDFAVFRDRDCWVFGDVLEHLRDPWQVLARIRKIIPSGGCIVLSVPNAQHWSVQAKLALGDFRYEDGGLFDRTHLRWFTRVTLLEMVTKAGFRIDAGRPRIFDEPQRERVLPAIRAMAASLGADPEQAVQDALPLQYVVRAIAQ